jgi:hypothetical protein
MTVEAGDSVPEILEIDNSAVEAVQSDDIAHVSVRIGDADSELIKRSICREPFQAVCHSFCPRFGPAVSSVCSKVCARWLLIGQQCIKREGSHRGHQSFV